MSPRESCADFWEGTGEASAAEHTGRATEQRKNAETGNDIFALEHIWFCFPHQSFSNMFSLRTPASFVWVYSKSRGIRIFSASSVLGLESRRIFDLYSRGVSSFFENHIECFIGDRRLNSTNVETLDALAKLPVERILELSAKLPE